jgi:hypothetical protein
VGTDEEYLLNVALWPGHGIDMKFVFIRLSRPLTSLNPIMGVDAGDIAVFGNLGVCLLVPWIFRRCRRME